MDGSPRLRTLPAAEFPAIAARASRRRQSQIDLASWPVLPIFKYLAKVGKMDSDALLESFNLGVGMILVVPSAYVKKVEADLKRRREKFFQIGRIERGDTAKGARCIFRRIKSLAISDLQTKKGQATRPSLFYF